MIVVVLLFMCYIITVNMSLSYTYIYTLVLPWYLCTLVHYVGSASPLRYMGYKGVIGCLLLSASQLDRLACHFSDPS